MDEPQIQASLAAVERELAAHRVPDLRRLGFWRAVDAVKRRPDLVAREADRIGRVDRAAFAQSVRMRAPSAAGLAVLLLGAVVGVVLLLLAPGWDHPLRELVLLVGFGALDATTHGLAHFVVGSLVGIRFTDAFVDLPKKPQPGLKIDYASYLRTPARSRAWMHASGAIATKVTPFAVLLYALEIGAHLWALAILVAVGIVQILTDVLFSVKSSDWKKFKREMRLARSG